MTVELKVDGQIYGGWKTVRIPFGIEQIANSFELSVTDKWAVGDRPRPIKPQSACQVLIDNQVVITGYVDDVSIDFDLNNNGISINGRDATGDLVDCSAIHKTGQWTNASLNNILRDLCEPYRIKVLIDAPLGQRFSSFSIQEGESVFECIDRACRMRAVLPISDGKGNLVLTRAKSGPPVATLIQGENIKYARGDFSARERFSQYIIKGQDRGSDDNIDEPEQHTQVNAVATDPLIKRYRPLIVIAEDKGAHATYKERAEWERNVRRGRSARATIRVTGWKNQSGDLWRANTLIRTISTYLNVDQDLLLIGGTYILDKDQGIITELSLIGREAFDLIAGIKTSKLKSIIKGKNGAGLTKSARQKRKDNSDDWGF